MTTFLVFSITRTKNIEMEIVKFESSDIEDADPFEEVAKTITPPYLGECIVVKEDDVRRFKLKSHVVEV